MIPRPILTLLVMGAAASAYAAERGAESQRERLQAEIRRVEASHAAQEAACRQQFAVTACIDETRLHRREALAPLRSKVLALDDAERRARAQERVRAVEDKKRQLAQRPEPPPLAAPRAASAPASAASGGSAVIRRERVSAQHEQAAGSAAALRAADSQRRRQEIERDGQRIRQRMAERELKGKKSAPLPTPAASAAR